LTADADIKKVLIISQTFPPDAGIGGRRWAKFARYFFRNGWQVEVIAANLNGSGESSWSADVEGISVFRYTHQFPKVLATKPQTLRSKIAYRLSLFHNRLVSKGTPYDRALFDAKAFGTLFSERMGKFQPDFVVVTGAPFNLMDYVAEVRHQYRSTLFLADWRDPWIGDGRYGYAGLQGSRLKAELEKESRVLNAFDLITSPWPGVLADISQRHSSSAHKVHLLSHNWDKDDISGVSEGSENSEIELIYGGSLYYGFGEFLKFLSNWATKKQVVVHLYTDGDTSSYDLKNSEWFKLKAPIPSRDFFKKLGAAKNLLFLIPEFNKDGFPTKLLEYAATGKRMIAVGYAGDLSRLIESRGLGKFVSLPEVAEKFEQLVNDTAQFTPDSAWINQHDTDHITTELMKMLNAQKPNN